MSWQVKPGRTVVLVMFDAGQCGEKYYRPWIRPPVLSTDLVKKLVNGALLGRDAKVGKDGEPTKPIDGDVVCLSDAGRGTDVLLSPFKGARGGFNTDLDVKTITVGVDQAALTERKKKIKADTKQTQSFSLVTGERIDKLIPERNFTKYPGTSRGEMIAWVGLTPVADIWQTTLAIKKEIYGTQKMFGDVAGEEDAQPGPKVQRLDTDMEPVFYFFLPETFYTDFLKTYSAAGVIDLTAGHGEVAKACLNLHIPYLGICYNDTHAIMLRARLTEWVKTSMVTPGTPNYNPELKGEDKPRPSLPKAPPAKKPKKSEPKPEEEKQEQEEDPDSESNDGDDK
jgi:hypothetical protein